MSISPSIATDGSDTLRGNSAGNVIRGLGGDDTLIGGAGDDAMHGGDGDDRLIDGEGSDTLAGGGGADTFIIDLRHLTDGDRNVFTDIDFGQGDKIVVRGLPDGLPGARIASFADLEAFAAAHPTLVSLAGSGTIDLSFTVDGRTASYALGMGSAGLRELHNVTAGGDGVSGAPAVSADGSAVVFTSSDDHLTPGDVNNRQDVFFYDTASHALRNVTQGGDAASFAPSLSADGSAVVFTSLAGNLTADDSNGQRDVFLYDTASRTLTNVTAGANGASDGAAISANASAVVFTSLAGNLTGEDSNGQRDVFLYDTKSHSLTNVTAGANGASDGAVVSADGSAVVFASSATNLTLGDSNGQRDVFLYDTASHALTNLTAGGSGASAHPAVSADGSTVVFSSFGNPTGDSADGRSDVFLYSARTNNLVNLTAGGDGYSLNPVVSADGATVAFESSSANLASGDTNGQFDIFVYDAASGRLANVTAGGNGASIHPVLSADGSTLSFESDASNLTAGDSNGLRDIFLYDLKTHVLVNATDASDGLDNSGVSLSADGSTVAYASLAAIDDPDGFNTRADVIVGQFG